MTPSPAAADAPGPPEGDQPLAPRIKVVWRVAGIVPVVVMVAIATVAAAVLGGGAMWLLPAVIAAAGLTTIAVVPARRYRRWRWRLTDRALELEHGLLVHRVRTLPYFRIQHIDLEHGPLDRRLGLAHLEVHTASVTAMLPGLHAADAPQIRSILLTRADRAVTATDRTDDAV